MRLETEGVGGALELEKGIYTGSVFRGGQKQACPWTFMMTAMVTWMLSTETNSGDALWNRDERTAHSFFFVLK